MAESSRRFAIVTVDMAIVAGIFQGTLKIEFDGLPPDAQYVRAFPDWVWDGIGIVFEHPSFERVEVGMEPPHLRSARIMVLG